jgi:predicted dehydrogenase
MDQAIAALRAGKHVLCEKPMARTSAEAREILEAEKASGKFLMPAMCMRFWPGWSWLKEAVNKQQFGKVLGARFRRVTAMPTWSKQGTYGADLGGALYDLHIHDTDFVQFLFGRPASVFSSGVIGADGSVDHVSTQYNYPGGPAVHAEGNWLIAAGFEMSYSIYCENATIDFDLARGADALRITEKGKDPRTVACDGDGYVNEIRYMLECVQQGKRPSTVTSADGMTALEICEAEERSVRTGTVVSL